MLNSKLLNQKILLILNSDSVFPFVPGNQGSREKGISKAMIGVISAVVATVLIIRKLSRMNISTEANVAETGGSGVTTENNLKSIMIEDDLFA